MIRASLNLGQRHAGQLPGHATKMLTQQLAPARAVVEMPAPRRSRNPFQLTQVMRIDLPCSSLQDAVCAARCKPLLENAT
jgi:hypothetical protein